MIAGMAIGALVYVLYVMSLLCLIIAGGIDHKSKYLELNRLTLAFFLAWVLIAGAIGWYFDLTIAITRHV